jgi:hypothetical protein
MVTPQHHHHHHARKPIWLSTRHSLATDPRTTILAIDYHTTEWQRSTILATDE